MTAFVVCVNKRTIEVFYSSFKIASIKISNILYDLLMHLKNKEENHILIETDRGSILEFWMNGRSLSKYSCHSRPTQKYFYSFFVERNFDKFNVFTALSLFTKKKKLTHIIVNDDEYFIAKNAKMDSL